MFIRLWLYKKSLQINSSWLKYTQRFTCWSKSHSTNRICWKNKKLGDDGNAADTSNDQSMFIITILEKLKETRLKFSQPSVTIL